MTTGFLQKIFGSRNQRLVKQYQKTVTTINALETQIEKLTDDQLRGKTDEFRQRVAGGESLDKLLPEAFAVCREASRRVLKMRHFDVQMIGGMVLHYGKIAEMRTGEGKTLVATLPVYLNALAGRGVPGGPVRGQARVDQRDGGVEVLRGQHPRGDAAAQHAPQHGLERHHVLAQPGRGLPRHHRPQVRAGKLLVVPEAHLGAHVVPQLLHRVVDLVEPPLQQHRVPVGLVGDEGDEQRLLVGEVVVHGGAADAGGGGDVRERDRVEPAVSHERREGVEEPAARLLAMFAQGPADDLWHPDMLPHRVR